MKFLIIEQHCKLLSGFNFQMGHLIIIQICVQKQSSSFNIVTNIGGAEFLLDSVFIPRLWPSSHLPNRRRLQTSRRLKLNFTFF
jgi:hypothetical protein